MNRATPVLKMMLAVLLFWGMMGTAYADRIEDIKLTLVQNGMLDTVDQAGEFCNSTIVFRATNEGEKSSVLEMEVANSIGIAVKRVKLAPGESAVLRFQLPKIRDSYYHSGVSLVIKLDGKSYSHGFALTCHSGVGGVMFSNSLPENVKKVYYDDGGKYGGSSSRLSRSHAATDSVAKWSRNVYDYMGYSTIWLDANEYVPEDVKAVLRQWVFDGGHLARCVKLDGEWPKDVPEGKDGFAEQTFGRGSIGTFRLYKVKTSRELEALKQKSKKLNEQREKETGEKQENKESDEELASEPPDDLEYLNTSDRVMRFVKRSSHYNSMFPTPEKYSSKKQTSLFFLESPKINLLPLMLAMVVFVALVGPANYFYLRRKRREVLMLVTIPAFSLLFSLLVVLYVSVAFGFKLEGRINAFTYFDQNEKLASSVVACSMMANSTNRRELVFTEKDHLVLLNETPFVVLPKPGMVLASSLLTPRNPVGYFVRRCEKRNEKIRFIKKEGTAEAINGLPVPIEHLIARAPNGEAYKCASNIAEGARQALELCPKAPAAGKYTPDTLMKDILDRGLLKKNLSSMDLEVLFAYVPAGSYLAICSKPCFCTAGITPDEGMENYVVFGPVPWEKESE